MDKGAWNHGYKESTVQWVFGFTWYIKFYLFFRTPVYYVDHMVILSQVREDWTFYCAYHEFCYT